MNRITRLFPPVTIGRARLIAYIVVALILVIGLTSVLTGVFGSEEVELIGAYNGRYNLYVAAVERAGNDPLDPGPWLEMEKSREIDRRIACLEDRLRPNYLAASPYCY